MCCMLLLPYAVTLTLPNALRQWMSAEAYYRDHRRLTHTWCSETGSYIKAVIPLPDHVIDHHGEGVLRQVADGVAHQAAHWLAGSGSVRAADGQEAWVKHVPLPGELSRVGVCTDVQCSTAVCYLLVARHF